MKQTDLTLIDNPAGIVEHHRSADPDLWPDETDSSFAAETVYYALRGVG